MRVGIGHINGLGQGTITDSAGNTCALADVDVLTGMCPETQQQAMTPYTCNWLENLFNPTACASAASPTPPLPSPPAPPASVGSACPSGTSVAAGTCSISGYDSNGNPVYVSAPQGAQYQAIATQQIQQGVAANYVDCSQLWNQLFNSACPCTYCSNAGTWVVIGIVGIGALLLARGILFR